MELPARRSWAGSSEKSQCVGQRDPWLPSGDPSLAAASLRLLGACGWVELGPGTLGTSCPEEKQVPARVHPQGWVGTWGWWSLSSMAGDPRDTCRKLGL